MSYRKLGSALALITALLVPATSLAEPPHAPAAAPIHVQFAVAHVPPAATPNPATEIPAHMYPGRFKAAVATVFAPLVGVAENRLGFRYPVAPYVKEVEPAASGRGAVVRSSRPSSLATNVKPELTPGRVFVLAKHTNPEALKAGYEFLYAKGVRAVVDLRFEGQESEARQAAEAAGLEYHNVKMKDNAWVNPQPVLVEALNAVEKAARSGKTVDVHCEAGIGRTGLVIAAHQALRQGMTEEAAVAYARGNGLELFGQEHALKVFVRGLNDGTITRAPDGSLAIAAREAL